MQVIGTELAVKWQGGGETFVALEALRRACPCASCAGERDIMGNVYKGPDTPLKPESFKLASYRIVGGYGLQPTWGDGHNSGIFAFDYLRRVAGEE